MFGRADSPRPAAATGHPRLPRSVADGDARDESRCEAFRARNRGRGDTACRERARPDPAGAPRLRQRGRRHRRATHCRLYGGDQVRQGRQAGRSPRPSRRRLSQPGRATISRSPTTVRRSSSTRSSRRPITTAASPTITRATMTAPSRTSTRRSSSSLRRSRTSTAATPIWARASTIRPSTTTTRPSASSRTLPPPSTIAAGRGP